MDLLEPGHLIWALAFGQCGTEQTPNVSGSRASTLAVGCPEGRPRRQPLPTRITYATPDLLLKHSDAKVVTYKRRHM
jgi:hypothetical protein